MKRQSVHRSQEIPDQPWRLGSGLTSKAITRVRASEQSLHETITEIPPGCNCKGLQNPWPHIFLETCVIRNACELLGCRYMLQRHAKLGSGNRLAHHELIRTRLAHNGAASERRCSDARIIYVKGLPVTQRYAWQVREGGWREKRNRSLRRIDPRMSRKGKVPSIEVLIVEGDLIRPIANVVMEHAQNRSICRNKRAVEIQRQIIVGYGLQDIVVSDVVQCQSARCLAPEVYARKQGERFAETLSVKYLFGIRVPVLALPD